MALANAGRQNSWKGWARMFLEYDGLK